MGTVTRSVTVPVLGQIGDGDGNGDRGVRALLGGLAIRDLSYHLWSAGHVHAVDPTVTQLSSYYPNITSSWTLAPHMFQVTHDVRSLLDRGVRLNDLGLLGHD